MPSPTVPLRNPPWIAGVLWCPENDMESSLPATILVFCGSKADYPDLTNTMNMVLHTGQLPLPSRDLPPIRKHYLDSHNL